MKYCSFPASFPSPFPSPCPPKPTPTTSISRSRRPWMTWCTGREEVGLGGLGFWSSTYLGMNLKGTYECSISGPRRLSITWQCQAGTQKRSVDAGIRQERRREPWRRSRCCSMVLLSLALPLSLVGVQWQWLWQWEWEPGYRSGDCSVAQSHRTRVRVDEFARFDLIRHLKCRSEE